jgi:protein O-GlcNAc transferase
LTTPQIQSAYALIDARRYEDARAMLLRALQRDPKHPGANAALSFVLNELGQDAQSLFYGQRALEGLPASADLLNNIASTLLKLGRIEEALEHYRRAIAADPLHLSAKVGETDTLMKLWRADESRARSLACLAEHPGEPRLSGNLAAALVQLGRARESVDILRAALAEHPGNLTLTEGLASAMLYVAGADRDDLLRVQKIYGAAVASAWPQLPPVKAADPDRALRVGLLSGDLRAHAVGFFAEPYASLGEGFEVYCYMTSAPDASSARFRGRAKVWREVGRLGFEELATRIRQDKIDILVELSGHTAGHRLPTMRMRPAPVQITAIGYPDTTGLTEIDYRMVDSLTDPPPEADRYATEELWRLDPCFLCYQPPPFAPAPRSARERADPIVFGSFSALAKLDDATVGLWSEVVNAVPGSRLLFKAFGLKEHSSREFTIARFAAAGLDPSRVELMGPMDGPADHLALYHRLDVALDTFPYNGTTTTCEALYMGVPVVTMAGRSHVSRVGLSLLNAVGVPELVGGSASEFLAIATQLAQDPRMLAALASELRHRLQGSTLCNPVGYATRLSQALRRMWRRACLVDA